MANRLRKFTLPLPDSGVDDRDLCRRVRRRSCCRSLKKGVRESIVRDVSQIESPDREALEHMLGQQLREGQRVMIHVVSFGTSTVEPPLDPVDDTATLPAWCHVFEGLSDQETSELEEVILTRADLTRPS